MESFLTPEQIDNDRLAIYGKLLERMDDRGGADFRSLRPSDIKWLFDNYDLTFFNRQIAHKLETTHGEISFHLRGETSECGYSISSNGRRYFFDISISIFKNLNRNEYCSDRVFCLMFTVEHQIIHFLMILYDYQEKISGDATYSKHGDLYKCMLRMFFGDVDSNHDLKGKGKKPRSIEKPRPIYQTLVICHGRKHARIMNLDYDTALFVDPSPESGSDLQSAFPSEKFNNLYGTLKFKNAILVRCYRSVLISDDDVLIPKFWIRLNKSLVNGGNVYIDSDCKKLSESDEMDDILQESQQYGFKYKGCDQLPYYNFTANGYILTKTREYSPKLGKEPENPRKIQEVVAKNIGRFSNVKNSCFLDSLLFVLLISDGSNYIRPILFDSNIQNVPYNVKQVCDRSRTIRTRQQVSDMAHRVRDMLKADYKRLRGGEVFQCNNLRRELRKCDPEIGSGAVYTPIEVYGIFAHLFPKLQVYFPPIMHIEGTRERPPGVDYDVPAGPPVEKIDIKQKITFSDLEYIPYSIKENPIQRGIGSFYLWDNMNEPLLVFHNRGENVNKFTEYIFGERYRLFGVVMSRGRVSTTQEGGGHYNAYVRIDGKWFFYDDMPPTTLRRLDALPKEALQPGKRSIGELLFYERIKEIPPTLVQATGTEKDDISFDPIEPHSDKFRLTVKYSSDHAGKILKELGGRLKMRGTHPTAYWTLDFNEVEDKKDQIENAVRIHITVSPQGDGSVMIYAEDRYGFLDEKFRNIGGKLVARDANYYGLDYHLRNRGSVLGDNIRDYYWKVSREKFHDTLAKIQKA